MSRKLAATVTLLCAFLTACTASDQPSRQSEVAEKGRTVMPFDLDKTTHRFTPRGDGLLQEVVADEPEDTTQITLIRGHLTTEAERFRRGDFADPANIHGSDMPGLAALSTAAAKITITYAELSDGASLTFHTAEPALVDALRVWSEAQVADHGKHAEHGPS
jgi:hypothetical protein